MSYCVLTLTNPSTKTNFYKLNLFLITKKTKLKSYGNNNKGCSPSQEK
jgi:hypothetical protein